MPSFYAGASPQKQQHYQRRRQQIRQERKSLPIASVEKRLVDEVRKNDTLIIVGETGSGKTTQLPQFLYDGGFCQDGKVIGITQPRRVAAITVARRVAEECNDQLGKKVGYSIRFDDSTSSATRIKYMTDGLLLREALLDPLLSKYSVIVVDEAHERTVHTDVLLGLLKKVQHSRANGNKNGKTLPDVRGHSQNLTQKACQGTRCAPLKLIIMSASLDAKCFSDYFGGAKAVHIQGRQYPVDILYTYQPESDYLDATLVTIFQVVLATNIAETSVTIPGIKYVIDPGMVKARAYNPVTGMESLIIIPVSKLRLFKGVAVLDVRGPGSASDCSKKALGIDDIIGFDFMEKPSRTAILKSLEQLILLGALTDDYKLSDPVGHQMARLPLDPMYSKALIVSSEFKCLEEMLIVVSMLSVESIFFSPREKLEEARAARKGFESSEGDHITLVNVYRAAAECLEKSKNANAKEKTMEKALNRWCRENFINHRSLKHARDVHSQIQGHVQQMGLNLSSCGDDMALFRRCLTASFFLNAAMRQPDGSYRALATSQSVQIHPSSVLFRTKPDCVIFNELVRTTQNYVKNLTRIDPLWLAELAPQYYATED
nr:unnamed protein product [Digitaria exilis]